MIGKNIYNLRKQKGYTLSELAERAGVSKSYLSSIERDLKQNPSIQVVEKVASVFEVDLETLLNMDVDPEKKQLIETEWLEFVHELKEAGVDKERINNYKILIEFIRWHNEKQ